MSGGSVSLSWKTSPSPTAAFSGLLRRRAAGLRPNGVFAYPSPLRCWSLAQPYSPGAPGGGGVGESYSERSLCHRRRRRHLQLREIEPGVEYSVVSFYKFVEIPDPEAEVSKHLAFLEGRDIHGRIYMSEQGINVQYSGPTKDALAYADWVREDHRFSDILVQISPAFNGHAFPRLKLRYKPSLVQLEGGLSHLPLVDPAIRAIPLSPSEWKKKLQVMINLDEISGKGGSCLPRRPLLLDVRNGYEWDIGHFKGAERPNVDCFRSTSFGLSKENGADSDPLVGIDKDKTDILMYCTGGIRCDVYSTILRQKGFKNLYTLSGGVSNYLKNEGPLGWVGNLFVFDARLSLAPSTYKPEAASLESNTMKPQINAFASCYICGSQIDEFRHRNCANIDCNLLFLSCSSCVSEFRGCCCLECTQAPRLRPVLPGHQRYQKWHIYRDNELQKQSSTPI